MKLMIRKLSAPFWHSRCQSKDMASLLVQNSHFLGAFLVAQTAGIHRLCQEPRGDWGHDQLR